MTDPWRNARDRAGMRGIVATLGPASVHELARSGYDVVVIDSQHSALDESDAAATIRSAPMDAAPTVVRVSALDIALIGGVLDAGAMGVIVPMIETAAQAEAAVAACRYPPAGQRSFGPNGRGMGVDLDELESRVACFVMIETARAVVDIEAIVATPGLGGVMVGPIDLSISYGARSADDFDTSAMRKVMSGVAKAARNAGLIAGAFGFGPDHAETLEGLGFTFVTVGTDRRALQDDARRHAGVSDAGATRHASGAY